MCLEKRVFGRRCCLPVEDETGDEEVGHAGRIEGRGDTGPVAPFQFAADEINGLICVAGGEKERGGVVRVPGGGFRCRALEMQGLIIGPEHVEAVFPGLEQVGLIQAVEFEAGKDDFEGVGGFAEDAFGVLLLPLGVEAVGLCEEGAADLVAEWLAGEGGGADGGIQGGESVGDLVPDEAGGHVGGVLFRTLSHF